MVERTGGLRYGEITSFPRLGFVQPAGPWRGRSIQAPCGSVFFCRKFRAEAFSIWSQSWGVGSGSTRACPPPSPVSSQLLTCHLPRLPHSARGCWARLLVVSLTKLALGGEAEPDPWCCIVITQAPSSQVFLPQSVRNIVSWLTALG